MKTKEKGNLESLCDFSDILCGYFSSWSNSHDLSTIFLQMVVVNLASKGSDSADTLWVARRVKVSLIFNTSLMEVTGA
jgi:hypothetical protein